MVFNEIWIKAYDKFYLNSRIFCHSLSLFLSAAAVFFPLSPHPLYILLKFEHKMEPNSWIQAIRNPLKTSKCLHTVHDFETFVHLSGMKTGMLSNHCDFKHDWCIKRQRVNTQIYSLKKKDAYGKVSIFTKEHKIHSDRSYIVWILRKFTENSLKYCGQQTIEWA